MLVHERSITFDYLEVCIESCNLCDLFALTILVALTILRLIPLRINACATLSWPSLVNALIQQPSLLLYSLYYYSDHLSLSLLLLICKTIYCTISLNSRITCLFILCNAADLL